MILLLLIARNEVIDLKFYFVLNTHKNQNPCPDAQVVMKLSTILYHRLQNVVKFYITDTKNCTVYTQN